jgi:hypothetical protein
MLTPTEGVLFAVILALFAAALILYKFLDWISYSDAAGMCAIAATGALIWAAAIDMWWGVLLTGVSLVPLTWTWWAERIPEDQE